MKLKFDFQMSLALLPMQGLLLFDKGSSSLRVIPTQVGIKRQFTSIFIIFTLT
jgi:hypothetical protein